MKRYDVSISSVYALHHLLSTLVVFRVYDTDHDGYISKDDLIHVSRITIGYNLFTVLTVSYQPQLLTFNLLDSSFPCWHVST